MKLRILISVALAWCVVMGWGKGKTTTKLPDCYEFLRGVQAYQEGNSQEALYWLNKEVSEHTDNGYAFIYISVLRYRNKEYGKALSAINNALKSLPKKDKKYTAIAYSTRGGIYLNMKDTVSALNDYDMAINIDPENHQHYDRRARVYYEQKRYDEALEQFDHAIKMAPNYSSGYSFRAEYYLNQKKYPEAIDNIIKALSIRQDGKALYHLTTMEKDALPIIKAKLQEQIEKNPNEAVWYEYLGEAMESHYHRKEAIDFYEQAYARKAEASILKRISKCYLDLGKNEAALDYIDRAIFMDSYDYNFVLQKSNIYNVMGRYPEAIAEIDKYVAEYPNKYGGYYHRAWIKEKAKDTDVAIEDYTMAIALEPEYAYSYLGRGRLYKNRGDDELARSDFRKIIELDTMANPGTSCAQYAYCLLGEKDKAIEYMDRLIAKNEDRAHSYYDAACLYSIMDEKEKAVGYLRIAFEHGFRQISLIETDPDLDNIRDMPEYRLCIAEWIDVI